MPANAEPKVELALSARDVQTMLDGIEALLNAMVRSKDLTQVGKPETVD
jgi:hypothetical protein